MRILFAGCRPGYPERVTGAAVSTYLLAGQLARNGAVVHHLCLRAEDGGTLTLKACPAAENPQFTIERVVDPLAALPATVAAFQPDLAILSAGANVELAQALGGLRVPIVIYQRDRGFNPLRALRGGDALLGVLACSEFIAAEVQAAVGLNAVVLPNIFPAERYRVPATGNLVTLINPVPAKGVDLALDLAERHRDLPFLFVEGWKMTPQLKVSVLRRAAALGNIRWQAPVANMRPVYARTRVLLVPSQWREAWGRVVTEAQISGIPVIAADRGGLPEAVGDGGMLLPFDDADAWSNGLTTLMQDAALWSDLSVKASAHAGREALDPNRIVARLICQLQDWRREAPGCAA